MEGTCTGINDTTHVAFSSLWQKENRAGGAYFQGAGVFVSPHQVGKWCFRLLLV